MKQIQPHIIIEDDEKYVLGDLKGNSITYDFQSILDYLSHKGQQEYGTLFKIHEEDREILFKLCNYFIKDEVNCKQLNMDLNKGILLSGPVGCGKTSLMKLLRYIVPHQKPYKIIPARNVVFGFNHLGYKTIEDYGDSGYVCFDDLGIEPLGRHYGKDCNVMGEVILSRYELFLNHKVKTHITTNLNAHELEERYGQRVRSRMREQFNLIAFETTTKDKRR
ncbi:ATPase [Tamlana sp. 2_MG-2023]|uniref:ATPase n=1 Tax=unclassified Tamlana TaxID=2614803 RepID=UPI0026E18E7A|nr:MULTISPECIES: ATPase [unclassified Tamlana]MDO6761863.1 ATPase [Tamlana sp. 2_MG-2023]MDO6792634.1 ATPase [Tamlana sp. 1_MG-2023]